MTACRGRPLLRTTTSTSSSFPSPPRWNAIAGASMNLGEALNVASHAIEEANSPRLDGVLAGTNWKRRVEAR